MLLTRELFSNQASIPGGCTRLIDDWIQPRVENTLKMHQTKTRRHPTEITCSKGKIPTNTSKLTTSTSHLPKPKLRPTHTSLRQRPKLPPQIPTRRPSRNKHRQNMLETRMRPPGITPLQQSNHSLVPRRNTTILLHRLLERSIKTKRIRLVPGLAATAHQIPQIVHSHPRANDQHPFLPERFQRFPKREVAFRGVRVEERDLHDRHVFSQRVLFGVEGDEEGREDAVVEAAGYALCFDPGGVEG
jgi:hypothetical protein